MILQRVRRASPMNIGPVLALLLLVAASADAATYKCSVDGRIAFQDRPCPKGTGETITLQADPGAARRAAGLQREELVPRLVQIETEQADVQRRLDQGRNALAARLGELGARGTGVDEAAKAAVRDEVERARREWGLQESTLLGRQATLASEEEAIRARLAKPKD
jgi:hypothetical protein